MIFAFREPVKKPSCGHSPERWKTVSEPNNKVGPITYIRCKECHRLNVRRWRMK